MKPSFVAKGELRITLDLIHFFIQKISSKFTFCCFKIFLKVPRNIFKIFRNNPVHLINFPNLFTISEKNLPISPKISSLFFKLIQKFFEIILKFLRLHKAFSKFSSGVLKIIFAKYTCKPHNIFSKFSLNHNKMFVKTLIENLLNLIKIDLKFYTLTIFKNFFITLKVSSKLTLHFLKVLQEFHKIPSKSIPNFCENSQQSSLKIQFHKLNFLNISA